MVIAKKRYGQHFLADANIARKIADSLININKVYHDLIEIGPGNGSLTRFLHQKYADALWLIEIDNDLIPSLQQTFPETKILNVDFLSVDFQKIFTDQTGIIGNFPYNISSQILIKILENRQIVPEVVGMFQKEVAERLVAVPGSKEYGRLSVLVQTFYAVKILFKVPPTVFLPPPKVESAVIRMERKENMETGISDRFYFSVVKAAFGQRRKTLKNSLKAAGFNISPIDTTLLERRAETLDFEEYIKLAQDLSGA